MAEQTFRSTRHHQRTTNPNILFSSPILIYLYYCILYTGRRQRRKTRGGVRTERKALVTYIAVHHNGRQRDHRVCSSCFLMTTVCYTSLLKILAPTPPLYMSIWCTKAPLQLKQEYHHQQEQEQHHQHEQQQQQLNLIEEPRRATDFSAE